jgi:glucokinase
MSDVSSYPRLLGDVGGTNARFAWQATPSGAMEAVATYPCKDYPTLLDCMRHYLREQGKPTPHSVCFGIATAIVGDRVKMTNHHWSFSISAMEKDLGVERMLVINDFTEDAVIRELRLRFGHASAERALSGQGIENLYQALCKLDGVAPRFTTAAEITDAAIAGSDAQSVETEAIFLSLLGTVAGNLALTLGARGGVYIGGGIVPRLGTRILNSGFRTAFNGKGRYLDFMSALPVYVINAKQSPALIGATRALDEL